MRIDYHYTTAFGAVVDAEIADALRAGMPIEKIASELGDRYVAAFNAACAKRALQKSAEIVGRKLS